MADWQYLLRLALACAASGFLVGLFFGYLTIGLLR